MLPVPPRSWPPKSRRRLARAAIFALAASALPFALASPTSAQPASEKDDDDQERVLAQIEVESPARSPFLLRSTVPLPRGVFPRADGLVPLGVRSHGPGRPVVPAQVEVVSRYPSGEADVIEVLARVELARGTRPGRRVAYELVPWLHEEIDPPERTAALAALVDPRAGGRLELRARDVFGNTYRLDLLAAEGAPGFGARKRLRHGAFLTQSRVAGVLVPDGSGPAAERALPRLLGAHAYLGEWSGEEVLSLELRVHNGLAQTGPEQHPWESALGIVYWRSLELVVPAGYTALPDVRDPFFGEPYEERGARVFPIVAPYPTDAMHMLPPMAQFHRRLAIAPRRAEDAARRRLEHEGLGFCLPGRDLWSWFEPRTARYFPQRELLARLDLPRRGGTSSLESLRAEERARHEDFRSQIEAGEARRYPREATVMGWAHPWFLAHEGGPGGEGIDWVLGHVAAATASREGYRWLELIHRMNASRQPQAAYDRFGEPLGFFRWLDPQGAIPFDYRMYGRTVPPQYALPCRGGPPASEHVRHVVAQGLRPPYDRSSAHDPRGAIDGGAGDILTWMPHDSAHLVRYTKHPKALVWLGNDALAKDDLLLCAELFRLQYHEATAPTDAAGRGRTLRQVEEIARRRPRQGLPVNREHAWGIDAFCAAYSTADDAWRARHRPWAERVADVLVAGATPGGLVIRGHLPELGNAAYEGAFAFQSQIVLLAQRSLVESVFRGVDAPRVAALEELLLRACDYLFFGPAFVRRRTRWSTPERPVYEQGPAWSIPIARADGGATPPFSDESHWGPGYLPPEVPLAGPETSYGLAVLSFAADASQRTAGRGLSNRYLRRTLDLGQPVPDFAARYEIAVRQALEQPNSTTNTVGYIARLQRLGMGGANR